MAEVYTEPTYFSDYFRRNMDVAYVVDTILLTNEAPLRKTLLLELHQHYLDYPCPKLKCTLNILNSQYGHKRYEKPPTSPNILQPGAELENEIFYTRIKEPYTQMLVVIDIRLLHQWIKIYFLPLCTKKYSWFALWRFLNDKDVLKVCKFKSFCEQMSKWFFATNTNDDKKPEYKEVCIYNGYLSKNPYQNWDKHTFLQKRRNKKQTEEGFDHLKGICYALARTWVVKRLQISNSE